MSTICWLNRGDGGMFSIARRPTEAILSNLPLASSAAVTFPPTAPVAPARTADSCSVMRFSIQCK